jgi:hypothetical protein
MNRECPRLTAGYRPSAAPARSSVTTESASHFVSSYPLEWLGGCNGWDACSQCVCYGEEGVSHTDRCGRVGLRLVTALEDLFATARI